MIDIVRPRMIRWWTESKQASGEPLISITTEIVHKVVLKWTAEEQERLATTGGGLPRHTLMEEHEVA